MALKQSPAHLNLVLGVSVVLAGKVFGYITVTTVSMCCEKVKFCVRCIPNSLAAPTLLTLVITEKQMVKDVRPPKDQFYREICDSSIGPM